MKTFIIEHSGVFIEGFSVVTAKNKTQAKKLVESTLSKRLKQTINTIKIHKIIEVDTKTPNSVLVSDGDFVLYKKSLFE